VFEDDDYVYLISEYMKGGELYDAIVAKPNFSEHDAAHLIKQLL
jgi:calcium-dependent protein kinase